MINVMQSGIASAERVFELLDAPEEVEDDLVPLEDLAVGGGQRTPALVALEHAGVLVGEHVGSPISGRAGGWVLLVAACVLGCC